MNKIQYIPLDNPKNHCYTHCLSTSAALMSGGHKLESLDKENPKKIQFIFERTSKLDVDISKYWSGDLRVEPRAYFDNLKMIKQRIYSA